MNPLCVAICVHFTVVVDRIEDPWAVVEWRETQSISDIALHRFTQRPTEGSEWRVHIGTAPHTPAVSLRLSPVVRAGLEKPKGTQSRK